MHRKVFISHASEDKERFVIGFAARLRATGIDAWLDRWEMLPGDSLVDKIFEEGLREAAAIIVIVSSISVVKPWVREEINAAFIKRVNSGSKLIPVIIDNCRIPAPLESTVWERINDISSYDESFNRIVAGITGTRDRPPLGSLPSYVTAPIRQIGSLAKIDVLVLKAACELALNSGHCLVNGPNLHQTASLAMLDESALEESLEVLERAGLITVTRHLGPGLPYLQITTYGFQQYANEYIDGYERIVKDVAFSLVNGGLSDNFSIASHLNLRQLFLVDHALEILESQRYIRTAKSISGEIFITNISASLRRTLEAR